MKSKLRFFSKLKNYIQQQQEQRKQKLDSPSSPTTTPTSTTGDSHAQSPTTSSQGGEDNTSPNTPRAPPKRRNSIKLILNPLTKALTKSKRKGTQNASNSSRNDDDEDEFNGSTDIIDFSSIRLEQVLDLNNIIEMCRDATDANLIQYLSRRDVIKKLISYLVVDYTVGSGTQYVDDPTKNRALNAAVHRFIASQDQMDARQHGNSPRPPTEDVGSPRPFDYTGVVIAEQEDSTMLLKLRLKYPTLCSEIMCSTLGQRYILPKIFNVDEPPPPSTSIASPRSPLSPTAQQHSFEPFISSMELQEFLFGFVNQEMLPLHLVRPYIHFMIHLIKINSKITRHFVDFLYSFRQGQVLRRFVRHVRCTDDVCELLLLSLLYHQKQQPHVESDSDSDNEQLNEQIRRRTEIKYQVIEDLFTLITDINYCENISAILSTIVTLPPDSILYLYVMNTNEAIVSMIDRVVELSKSEDVQDQTICSEVTDFFCTLVLHSHSTDPSMQAISQNLYRLSNLLVMEEDDVLGPIDDFVQPKPLGVFRLKLVELFVIIFKHYTVLTGPAYLVRERAARELLGETYSTNMEPNFDNDLANMLNTSHILQNCIYLFFRYHSHSILHNLITHLVTCLLEGGLGPFISTLLDECQLIQRILDAFERNKEYMMRTRISLGFMGHLSIIGSCVDDHIAISGALEGEWQRFRQYLEKKHFLECEYRHGGSIPLPDNFRLGGISQIYFSDDLTFE